MEVGDMLLIGVIVVILVLGLAIMSDIVIWLRDRARAGAVVLELGRPPQAKWSLAGVAFGGVALALSLLLVALSTDRLSASSRKSA